MRNGDKAAEGIRCTFGAIKASYANWLETKIGVEAIAVRLLCGCRFERENQRARWRRCDG
jgi:hypothetical protein